MLNKVMIIGNLGQDPEIRYSASGLAVANVTIATSEKWKDKQSGDMNEKTEWHRVVFFNRLAEIVGQYLQKGSKVYVEGSLQTRKWEDNSGTTRYTTEIVARNMQMLGGSKTESGNKTKKKSYQKPAENNSSYPDDFADFTGGFAEDDIPF